MGHEFDGEDVFCVAGVDACVEDKVGGGGVDVDLGVVAATGEEGSRAGPAADGC